MPYLSNARWLRLVAVLALMLGITTVVSAPARATDLNYSTVPATCPTQDLSAYTGGPGSWCINWSNFYGDAPESIGAFTVHINNKSDTSLDVPVPHGGLVFNEGGYEREVMGGFLRNPDDNSSVYSGRQFEVEQVLGGGQAGGLQGLAQGVCLDVRTVTAHHGTTP